MTQVSAATLNPSAAYQQTVNSIQTVNSTQPASSSSSTGGDKARIEHIDALSSVHKVVTDAVEGNTINGKYKDKAAQLPEQVGAYAHWAEDLTQSKKQGADSPTERFVKETAALVYELAKSEIKPEQKGVFYGGVLGNEIFQQANTTYVEPMLKSSMEKFTAAAKVLPYSEALALAKASLDGMLNSGGEARILIARLTGSTNAEEIGKRRAADDRGVMIDTCDSSVYAQWKANITEIVTKTIESGQRGDRAESWTAGGRTVVLSMGASTTPPSGGGTLQGSPFDPTTARYTFNWTQEGGKFQLTGLRCHHPSVATNNVVETGAEDFLAIARWNPGDNPDVLKKSIASFMYTISNSSTFLRGQMAVSEKIFDAALATKGVKLTTSPAWDRKVDNTNISYDQQALSMFTRDEFIEAAMVNLNLVPR